MYRLLIMILFLTGCQELPVVEPVVATKLPERGVNLLIVEDHATIKNRVALVIGNANYKFAPLNNPVNDAIDMAKALRSVGFHVIYKENAGWEEMDNGINEFEALLGKGVIGLFYFSGHGVQLEDKNYLIPVDLPKLSIRHVKFRSISAGDVLTAMEQKGNSMNLLILDACRDNPFKSLSKNLKRGLARMGHVPTGTLIAYATSPGDTAADGYGRNSPYTKHLVKFIRKSGLTVEMMFKRVRNAVVKDTSNDQTPWESSSLQGEDFYFGGKTVVASATDTPPVAPVIPIPSSNTGVDAEDAEIARLKREKAEAQARQAKAQAERERLARIEAEREAKIRAKKQAEIERLKRETAEAQAQARQAQAQAERERLAQIQARRKKTSKVFRDSLSSGGKGPEMVRIPAGSFKMGDIQGGGFSNEKPVHRVSVSAFALGKYEVTFAEYDKFAQATGKSKPSDSGWGRGNRPVIDVSWNDAVAYAKWLSQQTGHTYRLPTEAEWEYAARAGTTTKYWWGNKIGSNKANCDGCGSRWDDKQTAPVGSFRANQYGIYDTVGNVWEWCSDIYREDYYSSSPHSNPKGPSTGRDRVLRGGSWGSDAQYARAAFRFDVGPGDRSHGIGFRLVR